MLAGLSSVSTLAIGDANDVIQLGLGNRGIESSVRRLSGKGKDALFWPCLQEAIAYEEDYPSW